MSKPLMLQQNASLLDPPVLPSSNHSPSLLDKSPNCFSSASKRVSHKLSRVCNRCSAAALAPPAQILAPLFQVPESGFVLPDFLGPLLEPLGGFETYLDAYFGEAGIRHQKKTPLFRSARGKTKTLTENPMARGDVYRMIRRRARDAGIQTPIGCHSFRATGITAYLKNGGRLELAQQMAGHESARTTGLYGRRDEEITLDEVERITI